MSAWPLVVLSDSPAATKDLAGRLAGLCASGDVVLLSGDLGAGKTAFAQGFAAALGVEGPVTSPTFALVRQYSCADTAPVATLIHADVYRTGSLGEVVELALGELVEERAIALIEWGDLAAPALGNDALDVLLELPDAAEADAAEADPAEADADVGTERRIISIRGRGRWAERADEVAGALTLASSESANTNGHAT
jgi:tRNA threonylcarbamoyladenosine biosynthesis protein TsaE